MKATHAKVGTHVACGGGAGEVIAIDGKRLCFRSEEGHETWAAINDCEWVPSPAEMAERKRMFTPWMDEPLGAVG